MPTFHLHLRNVPSAAGNLDIRRFFSSLDIPNGGVQIVGGPEGNAFVTFSNYEHLLEATSYDKRSFMGNKVAVSLVNGDDIKEVVGKMMNDLGVQKDTPEIAAVRKMACSVELPSAMGSSTPHDFPTPRESMSEDTLWLTRRRAATPPRASEYSTMYAGGEAKRMRPSGYGLEEERYAMARSSSHGDRRLIEGQERMQKELEIELRIAQDIADQLQKKKDRIEQIKQGITKGPTMEELRLPATTMSRAEWDRRQPEPQPEPRYREMLPELYQGFPRRALDEQRYPREEKEMYRRLTPTDEPRYDRFGQTEPRSNQPPLPPPREGPQYDRYNQEGARYPEPSPYYEDQRPVDHDKWVRNASRAPPQMDRDPYNDRYRHEDINHQEPPAQPRMRNPYENQLPDMHHEHWERYPGRDQAPRGPHPASNYSTSAAYGGGSGPIPLPSVSRRPYEMAQSRPFFIKMSNVDLSVSIKQIRWFFAGYQITYGGILMQKNEKQGTQIAYIKFCHLEEARNCHENNKRQLNGREVKIEVVSESEYEATLAATNVQVGRVAPVQKELSAKKEATVSPAYTGSVKRTLCYITLKDVPEDATATSVWKQFGGSSGHSEGVLLFENKAEGQRMAFVAYKDHDLRDADVALHHKESASAWTDMGVYGRYVQAKPNCTLYKTTKWEEDVEISENDKEILDQKFFKTDRKTKSDLKRKEANQLILNQISRSLFHLQSTTPQEDLRLSYLKISCLPEGTTACMVWSWLGEAAGPCCRVTLITGIAREPVAFAAFQSQWERNQKAKDYAVSTTMGAMRALRYIARAGNLPHVKIFKSTDTGIDEVMTDKEKLALKEEWYPQNEGEHIAEETVHILKVRGISPQKSACKVWAQFGHSQGPVKQVTLMDEGESRVAFVKFTDRAECEAAQWKYPSSQIITADEMMKMIASCPLDKKIKVSAPKGELIMSLWLRKELVQKQLAKATDTKAVMPYNNPFKEEPERDASSKSAEDRKDMEEK